MSKHSVKLMRTPGREWRRGGGGVLRAAGPDRLHVVRCCSTAHCNYTLISAALTHLRTLQARRAGRQFAGGPLTLRLAA